MKKFLYIAIPVVLLAVIAFVIYRGNSNSLRPSSGIYFGILPDTQTSGVETTLTLSGTRYRLRAKYLTNPPNTVLTNGSVIYKRSNVIQLMPSPNAESVYYKVLSERELLLLDSKAKLIASSPDYILRRTR